MKESTDTESIKKTEAQIIDGKEISRQIKEEIKSEVATLLDSGKRSPHLVAVLVGEDGASQSYVASKEKQAKKAGFTSSVYRLDAQTTENELVEMVDFLNRDSEVDGFIVQLPLPEHIDEQKIIARIDPKKDVDGFHPYNLGKMVLGQDTFIPATPLGVMLMLQKSGIETVGKHCVVLGRSNIVGTPMSILMSRNNPQANTTVTLCHSKTKDIKTITQQADILIVAIGKPLFVTADMVKEGAVVIDVGIHRIKDESEKGYHICGDVDYENVKLKSAYITPVPGGVGMLTVTALLMNTLKAYKQNFTEI